MEKITKIFLIAITLISLYIVLCIGLDWFWKIGNSENADKINIVLINLSYSYIAGFIFYILVSYLPFRLKTEKLKPVVKLKIDNLYNQINACAQTFEANEIPDIIQSITKDQLKGLVNKKGMYNNSFYGDQVGYEMNNLKFLNLTKCNTFEIIDSLLDYKEYLKTRQVLNIEKIRDSDFFLLVKFYEDSPTAKEYYSSTQFKEEISKDLFEIIEIIRELKMST